MIKKIFIFLILGITFLNCTNDDVEEEVVEVNTDDEVEEEVSMTDVEFFENFGETVNTNIIGRVSDQQGTHLEGVEIKIATQTVYTDSNGYFLLNNVQVNERFAFVKASKTGYIDGSRTVVPNHNGSTQMSITLLTKNIVATLVSGQAGEASLSNGSKVTFDGNFSTESGNPYNGSVQVSMHYLPPNTLSTYSEMPGDLIGRTTNNNFTGLETYGMIAVNLFSPAGVKLNLGENSLATIELPIDNSQLTIAPETIPLWYFDELLGYWREEGIATKTDGKYIGQVSHFSFWNCDDFLDIATVCINITDSNNNPVSNHTVSLNRNTTDNNVGVGVTNENGQVCGGVPVNEVLTLVSYYTDCSGQNVISEQTVGPFTGDTTITVSLDFADFETSLITGTVINCDTNLPVEQGYVYFENILGNYAYPLENGAFNFNATYCVGNDESVVIGYNIANLTETQPVEFNITSSQTTLGQINACENTNTGDEDANVFVGNISLNTQFAVDSFGANGYTKIDGSIVIGNINNMDSITNLDALQTIIAITGDLSISYNNQLTSLFGLQSLKRVENDLTVFLNSQLEDLTGMLNLEVIGNNFNFRLNNAATSLDGLQNVTTVNDLIINDNQNLLSLEGLNGITQTTGNLVHDNNTSLQNVNALSNLISVGGNLEVRDNSSLSDFSGFDAIQHIENRLTFSIHAFSGTLNTFNSLETVGIQLYLSGNNITEIAGFDSLHTVGALSITGNSNNNNMTTLISGFNNLTSATVSIRYFKNLIEISGFEAMIDLERITVQGNSSLTSITGFNNVKTIELIFGIDDNPLLSDMSGFSNLESVYWFSFSSNHSMENFQDLSSLNEITYQLMIINCNGLINLTGLENITAIGDRLVVEECDNIENLEGLNNITTINGYIQVHENNNMVSLDGLESLITVEDVLIGYYNNTSGNNILQSQNLSLSDFCALQNLFTNGDYDDVYLLGIDYQTPTAQEIIDGNCIL